MDNRFIKVDGHNDLVRDRNSGAILNINANAMTAARERKKLFNDRQEEIDGIKSDVADIKNILMKLVEDKHGNNS